MAKNAEASNLEMFNLCLGGDENLEKVKQMLAAGFDVNSRPTDPPKLPNGAQKGTPYLTLALMASTQAGLSRHSPPIGIVKALLNAGADVDLANGWGTTPLMAAAQSGTWEGVSALVSRGAKLETKATSGWKKGMTARQVAATTQWGAPGDEQSFDRAVVRGQKGGDNDFDFFLSHTQRDRKSKTRACRQMRAHTHASAASLHSSTSVLHPE